MLPKKNRADKKTIETIFKAGKFLNSSHLTFKFILTDNSDKKISFIVPKSVSKLAVERNRLRRLGYSLLKRHLEDFPSGIQSAFVFKTRPTERSFGREYQTILENEIKEIFNKVR